MSLSALAELAKLMHDDRDGGYSSRLRAKDTFTQRDRHDAGRAGLFHLVGRESAFRTGIDTDLGCWRGGALGQDSLQPCASFAFPWNYGEPGS